MAIKTTKKNDGRRQVLAGSILASHEAVAAGSDSSGSRCPEQSWCQLRLAPQAVASAADIAEC